MHLVDRLLATSVITTSENPKLNGGADAELGGCCLRRLMTASSPASFDFQKPMPRRKKYPWEKLSDEQLLKRRLSSLRVGIEGTWLEDCLNALYQELEEKGILLRPHAWVSSEWFSPGNVPGIAVPFYLVHPRLMKQIG